jgi:hypothetical protein
MPPVGEEMKLIVSPALKLNTSENGLEPLPPEIGCEPDDPLGETLALTM